MRFILVIIIVFVFLLYFLFILVSAEGSETFEKDVVREHCTRARALVSQRAQPWRRTKRQIMHSHLHIFDMWPYNTQTQTHWARGDTQPPHRLSLSYLTIKTNSHSLYFCIKFSLPSFFFSFAVRMPIASHCFLQFALVLQWCLS